MDIIELLKELSQAVDELKNGSPNSLTKRYATDLVQRTQDTIEYLKEKELPPHLDIEDIFEDAPQQQIKLNSLVGKTLSHIDVDHTQDRILLTTDCGQQIVIYHYQDCCETVKIEDTNGDWHELLGKPLTMAQYEAKEGLDPPPHEFSESWTRTTLTFKVNDATVINRWIGESNGYYSENVTIAEVVKETD